MKDKVSFIALGTLAALHAALLSMAIPCLSRYYLQRNEVVFVAITAVLISMTAVLLQLRYMKRVSDGRGITVIVAIWKGIVVLRSVGVILQLLFC